MSTRPLLGLRGSGTWQDGVQPRDWNELVMYLEPNGDAPMTGMLSMLSKEQATDEEFSWWTKKVPDQHADVTGVYVNATLSTAYNGDAYTSGQTVYLKGAEASIKEFRVGHLVRFEKKTDARGVVAGKVTSRHIDGASSYIAVRLTKDANSTYDLETFNYVLVTGNSNAQGATIPQGISYEPVKYTNNTTIVRTPLSITRTMRKTRLRVGSAYADMKKEAALIHAIEREKNYLYGVKWSGIGDNGQPETQSDGLITAINNHAPATNVDDFRYNADFTGDTWLASGEEWIDAKLRDIFRYGSKEKMAWAGAIALSAINDLVKSGGNFDFTPSTAEYGIQVMSWRTTHGVLHMKTHPLFSWHPTNTYDLAIFEPKMLGRKYIDDTMFIADPEDRVNRNRSMDGTEEEFITEDGLTYGHVETMGMLKGLGVDNAL